MHRRQFVDATGADRCHADVTLRDKSLAQCGRRAVVGELCTQHAKIAARFSCEFCGGNDDPVPGHCMDCAKPPSVRHEGPTPAPERNL